MASARRIAEVAAARLREAELMDRLDKLNAARSKASTHTQRVKLALDEAEIRAALAETRRVMRPRRKGGR